MGVDYSAHLAYGVEIEDDREAFPDSIYEYEAMYAEAMMKEMGIELEEGQSVWDFLKGMPCPVNIMAFGAPNYTGDATWVVTPNDLCHAVDMYGGSSPAPINIGTPDPDKVKKIIKEFLELIGVEVPDAEPKWYFGLFVS